jgi:TPR repeat protein
MRYMKSLFLAVAVFIGLVTLARADFDDGQAAFEKGDYTAALREWNPLAEQGDADAQAGLGSIYANGLGVSEDHAEALKWYRKAADQGDAGGQNYLGVMYARGTGVPQDYAEAAKWYRKAAEQGDSRAQLNFGAMYARGTGVPQDYAEAAKWYRKAAELEPEAQYRLANYYGFGRGVRKDYVQAYMWMHIAFVAGQGNSGLSHDAGMALFNLANRMAPSDISEAQIRAQQWLEKHAE